MSIPTCVEWWQIVASGVFVVPLLQWLKTLPRIGPIVEQWAAFLAMILPGLFAAVASAATGYCDRVDPILWIAVFAGGTYLINQIVYHLGKKTSLVK